MDDQQKRETEKNQERPKSASPTSGKPDQSLEAAGTMVAGAVTDTMEQAKTMARNVGEQAWSAASNAGVVAQDLARQARDQATDTLYEQGTRAGQYLTRNVNEYPLTALLIAGAVGYGMAYLLHTSWQGQEPAKSGRGRS